jgi:tRNA(Ile)-lysidine synthase
VPLPSANELRPAPARIERFRRDLEALTGEAPSPDRKLAVAVSGGPDSLALLLLVTAAWPGSVIAATVDHGLRTEAALEALAVSALCARLGVPHDTLRPTEGIQAEDGNLQERARAVRYTLLAFWAGSDAFAGERPWRAEWIATAHQQDDVAETFLMRARRGAGLGGLARMRTSRALLGARPGPALIRPLLGWSRAELAAIVADAGIQPAEDPSNVHPRFDRSRIRALLKDTPELPPARLALAAANLRHAEDALEWIAEREWQARADDTGHVEVILDPAGLPYELRRRLTLRAIGQIHGTFDIDANWRGTGIDRLLATLLSGGTGTIAGVQARAIKGKWHFRLAPPRRSH